jgi:hypothetical protein
VARTGRATEPEGKTMAHDYKSKIEALLAKAERTDNEHERDAYTAQAQRLMLKMGIDEADLEARGEVKPEPVVQEHKDYRGSYATAMPDFANSVALGMGALKVIKSAWRGTQRVYVIGHQTDVDNFWMLMNSLEVQCMAGLANWWKTADERTYLGRQEGWKARRQFILSFGWTVGNRLREQRTEVHAEATPGAALVLVSKEERVVAKVGEMYPKLRNGRGLEGGMSGHAAGREAGKRANLGGKGISGGTAGELR